jgi:hypothetical protein
MVGIRVRVGRSALRDQRDRAAALRPDAISPNSEYGGGGTPKHPTVSLQLAFVKDGVERRVWSLGSVGPGWVVLLCGEGLDLTREKKRVRSSE